MNINDFDGAKLALMVKGHVLTILRDDVSSIPFPNQWDLPGGGREGEESALDCALRETFEETHLRLAPADITWRRLFPSKNEGELAHWFFVATPGWLTLPAGRLGDEGQKLRWMRLSEFLGHERAVPHLKERLEFYQKLSDAA